MGRSLRVSEEGLKRAKKAFQLTGWTQDYLAGSVECSRQTVGKFFAGGDVEKRFFEAICRKLNLIVADIADFELKEGQVNTSVSVNGNRERSLANLTQKSTETDEEKKVSFSILGTASKVDLPKLKAIVAHLQKITGDTSIEFVDIEKGSIRLILEGSQESLEQIEALFKSGQLTEVEGIPVEDVQFVAPKIPDHDEEIQAINKKRLAFTLTGNVSSEEIQELKAAFSETPDNDEEIEVGDKARLAREIITEEPMSQLQPDYHEVWNNKDKALDDLGRIEEAIPSHDQALKFKPLLGSFHHFPTMKDADALILKAFLAALCQQQSPLPQEVTIQLQDIAQSLEARLLDLHDLAIRSPILAEPYKQSRRWLTSTAAERGMGLKFLLADAVDDNNNQETDNITRDTQSAIEKTQQVFAAIDAKLSQASQVLSAPNPVQAAKQTFNP